MESKFKIQFLIAIGCAVNFLLTLVINTRQYIALSKADLSKSIFPLDVHLLSVNYNKERIVFNTLFSFYKILLLIFTVFHFLKLENFFILKISRKEEFFFAIYYTAFLILNIPFNFYLDFVIEKKYGFNRKTVGMFFKNFLLTATISFVCVTVAIFCIRQSQVRKSYVYIFLLILLAILYRLIIYPLFLDSRFAKAKFLEEGELKNEINKITNDIGFNSNRIFVIDQSQRSSHSNAFFDGYSKSSRIIFFDTIFNQMNKDEILAIFFHELGHWYHKHVLIRYIVLYLQYVIYFVIFNLCVYYKDKLSFNKKTICLSVITALFLNSMTYLYNFMMRNQERQADIFAVRRGYGMHLIYALSKLYSENLSIPAYDWIYCNLTQSHPPLTERIELILREIERLE